MYVTQYELFEGMSLLRGYEMGYVTQTELKRSPKDIYKGKSRVINVQTKPKFVRHLRTLPCKMIQLQLRMTFKPNLISPLYISLRETDKKVLFFCDSRHGRHPILAVYCYVMSLELASSLL